MTKSYGFYKFKMWAKEDAIYCQFDTKEDMLAAIEKVAETDDYFCSKEHPLSYGRDLPWTALYN